MVKKESIKQAFTARLIAACESAGITGHGRNKQVACALQQQGCQISAPGVWKWFNAQSVPDNGNLLALSQLLGVRVEWLQYGMEQTPEPYLLQDMPCQKARFALTVLTWGKRQQWGSRRG
ncbi:hypothetical protein ACFQUX_17005 [Pantoea stewartii]